MLGIFLIEYKLYDGGIHSSPCDVLIIHHSWAASQEIKIWIN